jgi:hypothetical protein
LLAGVSAALLFVLYQFGVPSSHHYLLICSAYGQQALEANFSSLRPLHIHSTFDILKLPLNWQYFSGYAL